MGKRERLASTLMSVGGATTLALWALYMAVGGFQFFWITLAIACTGAGILLYDKAVSQRSSATKSS